MKTTTTKYHLNRDCTHVVIEKLIYFFGFVIERRLTTLIFKICQH